MHRVGDGPVGALGALGAGGDRPESGRGGRGALVVAVGAVVVLAAVAWHLQLGRADLGWSSVWSALTGGGEDLDHAVVWGSRLPRSAAAVLVGAGLGVCGVLFQAATRNPVAEPATLGVNAGAFLAVTVVTVAGVDLQGAPRGGIAVLGGLAAALVVLGLGGRSGGARLALVGIAVTLALSAVAGVLLIVFEDQASGLFLWGSGALPQSGFERVRTGAWFLVPGLVASGVLVRRLDLLGLGDDLATSVGGRPRQTRLGAAFIGVVLCGGAVAAVGPIGFVGLAAPHLVRFAGVVQHRWLVPAAAVWGAAFLLAADIGAQLLRGSAVAPEQPAGVVAALLGAPVLLLAARQVSEPPPEAGGLVSGGGRVRRVPAVPVLAAGVAVLGVVGVAALTVGGVDLSLGEVWAALWGGGDRMAQRIVLDQRLPRVLLAGLVGAALATAGAVLQGVTRNPLADPSLLGVTSGAALAALGLRLLAPGTPLSLLPLAALAGGAVAMAVVVACSWKGGLSPERLVLMGVSLAAFCAAASDALVARANLRVAEALVWLSGTTYGRGLDEVRSILPWVVVLVVVVWAAGRSLDLLALGDDLPRTLGVSLRRARLGLVLVACTLAAATVAYVGPIGFVGLLGPHAVRSVAGPSHRRLVPMAAVAGAVVTVAADAVGRSLLGATEVPAGLVTSLVGLPVLVVVLVRTRPAG